MKKLLLLLVLLIGFEGGLMAQWQLRNSNIYNGYSIISQITTPSEKTAYAIGYNSFGGLTDLAYYTKTTNGGINWKSGYIPGTEGFRLTDITSTSDDTVWILMYDGYNSRSRIYKTTDGGVSWFRQGTNAFNTNLAEGIHFFNSKDGVAFTGNDLNNYKEIYTTSDAGNTWVRVPQANIPPSITSEYKSTYTTYGNTIWFGNMKGRIYKSMDKGHTWTFTTMPYPAYEVTALAFSDANNGLALATTDPYPATNIGLFRTTNGGATWTNITPPATDIFYQSGLCYVPGTQATFVVAGFDYINGGNIVKGTCVSTNGGSTWEVMSTSMPREATSIKFFNQGVAYAGTYAQQGGGSTYLGGIYQFTFSPDVGVTATPSPVSDCYKNAQQVCVAVKNFGLFPASNVPVTFKVDGGASVTEILPGPIESWATKSYCFSNPALISASGTHTIQTRTLFPGDMVASNDSATITFTAAPTPVGGFDIKADTGRTFSFQDINTGATTFKWYFGDNDSSSLQAPTHTYPADGQYEVKLIATNAMGCVDTTSKPLTVKLAVPQPQPTAHATRVFPNPTTGTVYIDLDPALTGTLDVKLYSSFGQLVRKGQISGPTIQSFDLSGLQLGMYTMKITGSGKTEVFKLILIP